MKLYSGDFTSEIGQELIALVERGVLTPIYRYSEFRLFDQDKLFELFIGEMLVKVDGNYQYVRVQDGDNREAWALISESVYDSSIFGFKVGTVETAMVTEGFSGGYNILFTSIVGFAKKNFYRYLNLSLNTNDSSCPQFVNAAANSGFYYINTLVTFGFTKQTFSDLNLDYKIDPEISVRFSTPDDFEPLYRLAAKAYKIDRYHLDNNLPKHHCDRIYSESLRNSFFDGFVDGILVATYHEEPIGYFSGKYRRVEELGITAGTGVVSSVSPEHRGLGVFQAMNKALIEWLNQVSDFSEYGTYINNHPVHSVYIKSRMRMVRGALQMALYLPGY